MLLKNRRVLNGVSWRQTPGVECKGLIIKFMYHDNKKGNQDNSQISISDKRNEDRETMHSSPHNSGY